jgi:hypothetical protein
VLNRVVFDLPTALGSDDLLRDCIDWYVDWAVFDPEVAFVFSHITRK